MLVTVLGLTADKVRSHGPVLRQVGFEPMVVRDVAEIIALPDDRIAAVIGVAGSADLDRLSDVRNGRRGVTVAAALPAPSVAGTLASFAAGAHAVVDLTQEPLGVAEAVLNATQGLAPLAMAPLMRQAGRPNVRLREHDWLRDMSGGASIEEVARAESLSVRTINRRLRALYRRLGVDGRGQAIRHMRERGLL